MSMCICCRCASDVNDQLKFCRSSRAGQRGCEMKTLHAFESKRYWQILLLANCIMEIVCLNPWEPDPLLREWKISRYVNYNDVCLQ